MKSPHTLFTEVMAPFLDEPDQLSQRQALDILEWVENALRQTGVPTLETRDWELYLEETRHPRFLTALPDHAAALRWADTTFRLVEELEFTLGKLLDQRTSRHPDHHLFQDLSETSGGTWSYRQILQRVRSNAAVFLKYGILDVKDEETGDRPTETRVALLCENGIGSACCDLACLTHDIFVSPLNVHFNVENLAWIFDRLNITCAVSDHPERLEKLVSIREKTRRRFVIFSLNDCRRAGSDDINLLEEWRALQDSSEIDAILEARPRRSMREVSTVMFTSGSTGRPKGVAFSQMNLVSKRFARAAALPEVGRDETLLCYLPLFHTFGRYLEMLGTIFWGGTYVFAGNPSAETLIAQFQEIQPTALISVPVRWVQIRERILELTNDPDSGMDEAEAFRHVTGTRLFWGLSAAGFLDPKVFRFYHRGGVALCSGFGMTEGTGGLTMTPPDDYVPGSVGIPLPGVAIRFGELGELQIAGPYIARYLPEDAPFGDLTVEEPDNDRLWLPTGDLFKETSNGHLEIVDRIKDIYKNNRGQTVAPRKVESLFDGVPGIKNTFLAGDGRSFNTLLIVPDTEDEVLRSLTSEEERREYFNQIVTTANPGLPSFERVVNFAILDRDFSADKGELTPKGSFKRKIIEKNFSKEINELYQTNTQVLKPGQFEVQVPRWFFRDLGLLDDAITVRGDCLVNTKTGTELVFAPGENGRVRIGDLEYHLTGNVVDLGLLSRQPRLWMANPQLIAFCPCKLGWDSNLGALGEQVSLPSRALDEEIKHDHLGRVDPTVDMVNTLCTRALFGNSKSASAAIKDLDDHLGHVGNRLGDVIRRRLEALANHPDKSIRCRSYQLLVLDQPVPDYLRFLPAFIESGKPFLDETSFEAISRASIEPRRLQALRQRLFMYRTQLNWPSEEKTRILFQDLFRLLADFGRYHPEFYNSIREELVCWIMHTEDPKLAESAKLEFNDMATWFEARLKTNYQGMEPSAWDGKISFQEGLSETEVGRLKNVLIGTTFLKQSIMLAFEGEELSLQEIGRNGIWVSRIISRYEDSRYRLSVNTKAGKHFDLQLIINETSDFERIQETIYWYIVLKGYPFGTSMLPNFGCCRPELGALSMGYVSDLTVWEKIREFSSVRGPGTSPPTSLQWHQLLVRAMSVVVKGWRNSGHRLIPGLVSPNNIVVPEPDFRKGAVQNNLAGWKYYEGPLSLIRPIWRNIYQHTLSHYPWIEPYLDRQWIFEAFVEALGVDEALVWFYELRTELTSAEHDDMGSKFREALDSFIVTLETKYYQPRPLRGAIGRFAEWHRINTQATVQARVGIIEELSRLYRLRRLGDIARFTLFRGTYFLDADIHLLDIFDRLLVRMHRHPQLRATQMVELSELQSSLSNSDDRVAFNRMVFPHRQRNEQVEVKDVGTSEINKVVVRSKITDEHKRNYLVCEPAGPAEVGHLYRLFLQAGFPKSISSADHYLVAMDDSEQIIGGAVYRPQEDDSVFLDGIVVSQTLWERGIAGAILADFATRMRARGIGTIRTHFFLRQFYQRHGFRLDNRHGGLVRNL
jgi:long-chain acyl-CoA synthetase